MIARLLRPASPRRRAGGGRLVAPDSRRRNGTRVNERPIEYRFVFDVATRVAPTTVLDVGTGKTSLPHLLWICGYEVTAIDNVSDYWADGLSTGTSWCSTRTSPRRRSTDASTS